MTTQTAKPWQRAGLGNHRECDSLSEFLGVPGFRNYCKSIRTNPKEAKGWKKGPNTS
jgi:hypothetical protein